MNNDFLYVPPTSDQPGKIIRGFEIKMESAPEWEARIIKNMTDNGWVNDHNDEERLGFTFKDQNGKNWVRDYYKKTRSFVHFCGDDVVNLLI
jgi:hypothetical protein